MRLSGCCARQYVSAVCSARSASAGSVFARCAGARWHLHRINAGEGATGGLMQKSMPQAPNAWLSYVLVASVADTVTKAEAHGGRVVVPRMDVPTGACAVLADPNGAVIGVFEEHRK